MKTNPAVTEYIEQAPVERQEMLRQVRAVLQENLPESEEQIKYGMPTYYYRENLIHFAAAAKHLGLYPTPSVINHFRGELATYNTTKGAIQFPYNRPIPYKLIGKIARWRRAEVLAK